MRGILLTIAYDGTNYSGWQVQDNALTVQACMMEAGRKFLPAGFTITTASRTDAGVHALGQRALVKTDSPIDPERIYEAFNHYLPKDIRVWRSEEVGPDFHPRYHASKKLYVYKIWNGRVEVPAYQVDHVLIQKKCKLEKMQYIADRFLGQHDFNAFSSTKKKVTDTVRQIYRCQVVARPNPYIGEENGMAYEIYIEGNGFLYNMVRIMAGCIIAWSSRQISLAEIDQQMERAYRTGQRIPGVKTMPAKGLTLLQIDYD